MDRTQIEANGFTFDAYVAGPDDGELVVFLHGFPQTSWSWRNQIRALSEAGYRCLAPDQRGYSPGARPTDVDAYRSEHLTSDVLAFADAVGADRFHLVGHDWGGAIAWQVAGRHGDRLRTLTVLSTPHPFAFAGALADAGGSDQAQRSSYVQIFREEGSEKAFVQDGAQGLQLVFLGTGMSLEDAGPYIEALGTEDAMRAALNWYRAADLWLVSGLGPITVPTMYLWSTEDPALGREAAEATAQHVEGPYRFEVFEGVNHWIAEFEPERTSQLLLEHLSRGQS